MEESANVTIRLEKKYKEFLERAAKSRFMSLSSLLKQASLLWLEKEKIDYSEFIESEFRSNRD